MIKVVNVISDTNIGGAGKCVINFARNYDQKKYDVSVVVPKGSALIGELEKTPVKIIEIDGIKDKSLDIKALFKLIKILKTEEPDIVHTHATSIARVAAKFVDGARIIYTRHCAYPVSNRIKKGLGKVLYKNINELLADRIIAVGNAAEENLLDGGISKEKIDTFFNGVEKIEAISDEAKKALREQYGIKDDDYVIGIVARLEEVKGHETFIDAAKILLKENKIKAKFLILGTGTYEEKLKNKVKELKLEKEIIFTGFVKNVGDYLNIMDVQVNCSFGTETSSLSLLEGMSIGVPAVVSNYGGNPYLISDGENGYIVPIKSPERTANAILKILKNDDVRKHMNEKAVEIYNDKFTIERYVNNVQNVYEKVMSEPRSKRINTLDIFIILLVFVSCLVGYKFIGMADKTTEVANTNSSKVVYTIKTTETIPEVFDMIEVGTKIYESSKNYYLGTVINKESTKTVKYGVDIKKGKYVENELEDYVDIILTIDANAQYTDQNIEIGEFSPKVGKEVNVKGKGYAAHGYIISIER